MRSILRMLGLTRSQTTVQMVEAEVPVDPRQDDYDQASAAVSRMTGTKYVPTDPERQRVFATGIVDGWHAAEDHDPERSIEDVVRKACRLMNRSLSTTVSIWDVETAKIRRMPEWRAAHLAAVGVGRDTATFWEHAATLPRHLRTDYGAAVGMGVLQGTSDRTLWMYGDKPACALRKVIISAIADGLHAKTKGVLDKRPGLFDQELTEDEWTRHRAA